MSDQYVSLPAQPGAPGAARGSAPRPAGILLVALAVAGLVVAGCSKSSTKTTAKPRAASTAAAVSGKGDLGKPVRDPQFEYVVTKVEYKKSLSAGHGTNTPTKGMFAVVSFSMKSLAGDGSYNALSNSAYDAEGTKYDGELAETVVAGLKNQITPQKGKTYQNFLVFDVPANAKIARVVFTAVGPTGDPLKTSAVARLG
jgi:hypothetical protein